MAICHLFAYTQNIILSADNEDAARLEPEAKELYFKK